MQQLDEGMASEADSPPRFDPLPKPRRPTFRGCYTEDVEAFINNSNAYFALEKIIYCKRLSHLWRMLQEDARVYCKIVAHGCKNVDTLYEHLRKKYGGPWYTILGTRELFQDRQRPSESNTLFVERKMFLIKKLAIVKLDVLSLVRGQFRPANPVWSLNEHVINLETLLLAANYIDQNKTIKNENMCCNLVLVKSCPLNHLIHPELTQRSDGEDLESRGQSESQAETQPSSQVYDEGTFENFYKKMQTN